MITENDYPMFTYFIQCYMCDSGNWLEQVNEFIIFESVERNGSLCKELLNLMKTDKSDIQAFVKRTCKRRYSINEINTILNTLICIFGDT